MLGKKKVIAKTGKIAIIVKDVVIIVKMIIEMFK